MYNINVFSKKRNYFLYKKNIKKQKSNLVSLVYDRILRNKKKKQKYLFYETYFGIYNNILINLKLNNFPFLYDEFGFQARSKKNTLRKDTGEIYENPNDFENFFQKIIFKILPQSYLENFEELKNYAQKLDLNPKVIFTANAHVEKDLFKIWSAEQIEKKTKLIISDHGGVLEDEVNFRCWNNISDTYIKWSFSDQENTIQMPPGINLKKVCYREKKQQNILVLFNNEPLYPYNIHSPALPKSQYNFFKNFFKNLDEEKKKYFYFRPHPSDNWNIRKKTIDDYGIKKISNKKKFSDIIINYKLLINTVPQTTFLESLASGVPTILFYNENFLKLNSEIESLLMKMKQSNMIFDDAILARNHINKIWDNPFKWWNSDEINNVRKSFFRLCSMKTKNDLLFWVNFLKKI